MPLPPRVALLLLLLLWLPPLPAAGEPAPGAPDAGRAGLIMGLFPKATRIGAKRPDLPVYPVFQLQELLGFAYESADLIDLPGFSGKPIRLLIGLDTQGGFRGVKVLDHHEPVFLHGLGQEPLLRFVDQYRGKSLTRPIVIDGRRASDPPGEEGPLYIDGVTKATVSVIIINDTVLASALQVARQTLEGFSQPPPARAKADLYEPLDWPGLRQRGYIHHWALSRAVVEQSLGHTLDSYPGFEEGENPFSELHWAYLNAPVIGRNLLGDARYRALMESLKPGEQVFAVLSRGDFLHVPDDFKPGTVPGRLALAQQGLAMELRDLNALDESAPFPLAGVPDFERAHLFRIKGHAGFNPAAPAELTLNVALARNHLVQDQALLAEPFQVPEHLFEAVEVQALHGSRPDSIWLGLWQQRWPQILVLSLALVLLTLFFLRQAHYSRNPRRVQRFRWGYLIFTLLFIGIYAQGQLSVVNIYTLLLSVTEGFDIRIFLLDPVIFILWCYTFITVLLWGRGLFCGWLCPFGALQEMLSALAGRLGIRQWRVPEERHRRLILLKYPLLLGLVGSAFYSLTLAGELAEVEPFKTSITLLFQRSWPFVLYALVLLALGMVIHKFYCRYLCPLGAGLAVLGRLRRFSWLPRIALCGDPCQLCRHRCEIGAIRRDGAIDYDECIQCLECRVILEDEDQCVARLQARKRKKGLPASDRIPVIPL